MYIYICIYIYIYCAWSLPPGTQPVLHTPKKTKITKYRSAHNDLNAHPLQNYLANLKPNLNPNNSLHAHCLNAHKLQIRHKHASTHPYHTPTPHTHTTHPHHTPTPQ